MKRMRMLSVLLVLLLALSLSLPALAADGVQIAVESSSTAVQAGEEVTLAVSIANNPGFVSGVWKIGYDSSKLALQSINTAYSAEINGKTVEILYLNGIYTPNAEENLVAFANATPVTDNGTIFTLTFLVKQSAASGEAAVSVTAKELFAKGKETIVTTSVSGGVTIAESTTGGSTTGGSTTGGSTTGGSTTGGSTTGGSTTGGSTTGGSTTGGSTTGGSTTGGSTTGGSTTGGSTTGGSTTGGSTTGGSTTGGSTTGGSTTGGSTTGGSTTGGSTTGGSTTGGSTTGGSTTGGSTTGGSTTGGSTTGGSTTGGSTTGGSTTGGSTTGGSTTGAVKVTDIAVGEGNYSVTGQTVTVTSSAACKLGYLKDGKYIAIPAAANSDGSYRFEVPDGVEEVLLVVKGDANGDGKVTNADITALNAANMKKSSLSAAQEFACDINGDGKITNADVTKLNAANLKKDPILW